MILHPVSSPCWIRSDWNTAQQEGQEKPCACWISIDKTTQIHSFSWCCLSSGCLGSYCSTRNHISTSASWRGLVVRRGVACTASWPARSSPQRMEQQRPGSPAPAASRQAPLQTACSREHRQAGRQQDPPCWFIRTQRPGSRGLERPLARSAQGYWGVVLCFYWAARCSVWTVTRAACVGTVRRHNMWHVFAGNYGEVMVGNRVCTPPCCQPHCSYDSLRVTETTNIWFYLIHFPDAVSGQLTVTLK